MKCPHCEYVNGGDWEDGEYVVIQGEVGEFYKLETKVHRERFYQTDSREVYACPSCMIMFIDG